MRGRVAEKRVYLFATLLAHQRPTYANTAVRQKVPCRDVDTSRQARRARPAAKMAGAREAS
jgi:hypothetical protein